MTMHMKAGTSPAMTTKQKEIGPERGDFAKLTVVRVGLAASLNPHGEQAR
jgi:hypothetical protein